MKFCNTCKQIKELDFFHKKNLESKFQSCMSWSNYSEWHIDHIFPLSKFDLTNREELVKACHYSNLQPLWASENLSKHAKLRHYNYIYVSHLMVFGDLYND